MPTRNVVLAKHQASFVERLVSTGRYQNASEVLREGLRMVEQREADDASRLEALRSAVRVGIDDFEQGRYAAFESGAQLKPTWHPWRTRSLLEHEAWLDGEARSTG